MKRATTLLVRFSVTIARLQGEMAVMRRCSEYGGRSHTAENFSLSF